MRSASTLGPFAQRNMVGALAGHEIQRSWLGPAPRAFDGEWVSGSAEQPKRALPDDFVKVPGSTLRICPEWAEAMGMDPDKMEKA